jgi:hypothetical protein
MSENLYVMFHSHRHGTDIFPFTSDDIESYSLAELALKLGVEYEEDREEEYVDVMGPYDISELPFI